jgi:hypothetical protein
VFLLLSAAPAHALYVVVLDIAITNSTPVTLSLTDSDNGGGGSCWSDISADCVSGPPAEIDPGATVHVYAANNQLLPDVQGHVTYQGANTQAGFFHPGRGGSRSCSTVKSARLRRESSSPSCPARGIGGGMPVRTRCRPAFASSRRCASRR